MRSNVQNIEGSLLALARDCCRIPDAKGVRTLFGLTALGLLGNHFNIELYFGVNFLFGGIATMIAIRITGPLWGALAGLVIGSYTLFLWGHPYAFVIFGLEAFTVGIVTSFLKKEWFVLADLGFWLLVGMPLVAVFYFYQLGLPEMSVLLIALKQSVNGIFNVVFANLLVQITPLLRLTTPSGEDPVGATWSMRSSINNIISAFIILPLLISMAMSSQGKKDEILENINLQALLVANDVAHQIGIVLNSNLSFLQSQIEIFFTDRKQDRLRSNVGDWVTGAMSGLINIAIHDAKGKILFSHLEMRPGASEYLEMLLPGPEEPALLSVFHSDNITDEPHFTAVAALSNGRRLVASFSAKIFKAMNIDNGPNKVAYVELLDGNGNSVLSRGNFAIDKFILEAGSHQLKLIDSGLPPMVHARNSFWTRSSSVFVNSGWQVKVVLPMTDAIDLLQKDYIEKLAIMFGVMIISLFAGTVFSRKLSQPLLTLANITEQFSESTDRSDIHWAKTNIFEVNLIFDRLFHLVHTVNLSKAELKNHQEKAVILSEIASDWSWQTGTDLRLSNISHRFSDIVGISQEDLIGIRIDKLFVSRSFSTNPQQYEHAIDKMRPFRDFEFEVLGLSGSVHYFQVSGSPTYDKNGHFLGYLGVGQNINLRKQRELELTQLMLAINNLSESIVLFDTTDRIVFSNTAFRAMNKSIAEFTTQGTLFEDYLRANVRAELVLAGDAKEDEWIAERIAQHHKPQGPIEIFRQDGKTVLVNEQVFPDIGTILIISDITANKVSEAQVIQASKLATLGEMAAGMAHELNQPLNVIRLAAGNILRKAEKGILEPELMRQKLERISDQTERAAKIIDHMAIFGREVNEPVETVNVIEAVNSSMSLMGEQLRLDNIELRFEKCLNCFMLKAETFPTTIGYQTQLEQVFLNLMSNAKDALKNIASKKRLSVGVHSVPDDGKIVITFTDTGDGISEKNLKHIFAPFYTTKEAGKGTGLGLSVSFGIIRDMGGTINAENYNGGARFIICLPIAKGYCNGDG